MWNEAGGGRWGGGGGDCAIKYMLLYLYGGKHDLSFNSHVASVEDGVLFYFDLRNGTVNQSVNHLSSYLIIHPHVPPSLHLSFHPSIHPEVARNHF